MNSTKEGLISLYIQLKMPFRKASFFTLYSEEQLAVIVPFSGHETLVVKILITGESQRAVLASQTPLFYPRVVLHISLLQIFPLINKVF